MCNVSSTTAVIDFVDGYMIYDLTIVHNVDEAAVETKMSLCKQTMSELFDVSRLTNDPILHLPYWPPIPTKIPGDCLKFKRKSREYPQGHVLTYHLWFIQFLG